MTRILFVHGRSQQGKSSDELRAEWTPALERGLAAIGRSIPSSVEFDFPFYGDTLDRIANGMELPLDAETKSKGGGIDAEYLAFRYSVLEQIRINADITEEQVDADFDDKVIDKGPQNWEWVHRVLRALDKHTPGLRDSVLDKFLRDVFIYLTNDAVRNRINKLVEEHITERDTIVVGHSLGTVVAYDVLIKTSKDIQAPVFITMGSPLGIKGISVKVRPLKFPSNCNQWFNAFDERDVVALNPLDRKYFPVTPNIENKHDVKNHTENRHSIGGHLDDTDVAQRIVDALGA